MLGILAVEPGNIFSLSVGRGGAGGDQGTGAADGSSGENGTASSFDGINILAGFGLGGTHARSYAGGGTITGGGNRGGCQSGNSCRCEGCLGSNVIAGQMGSSAAYNYTSQASAMGGAGGGSPLGGPGAPPNSSTDKVEMAGTHPGGGGGGGIKYNDTTLARPGSNGANGRVTVWWY